MSPILLSFEVAFAATVLASCVGIVVAGLLTHGTFPGKDWIDAFITSPLVLPPTVLGYGLLVLLGRSSVIGRAFESFTGSPIVFTRTGAIIAASVGAFPLIAKSARSGFESVNPRIIAAARTLGAGPVRVFFSIVLPLSRQAVVAGCLLGFARALGDFGITLMVSGNIPGLTQTASLAIYDAVLRNHTDEAIRLSTILTLSAATILYVVAKLTRKERDGF